MDFAHFRSVVLLGFIVWLGMAPKLKSPHYGESFFAYVVALLLCLIGTSEIILIKPIPFFFSIGGVFAFILILARLTVRIRIKK